MLDRQLGKTRAFKIVIEGTFNTSTSRCLPFLPLGICLILRAIF